jgi:hypothetical protein
MSDAYCPRMPIRTGDDVLDEIRVRHGAMAAHHVERK